MGKSELEIVLYSLMVTRLGGEASLSEKGNDTVISGSQGQLSHGLDVRVCLVRRIPLGVGDHVHAISIVVGLAVGMIKCEKQSRVTYSHSHEYYAKTDFPGPLVPLSERSQTTLLLIGS
jgi:hypothetical protein